MIRILDDISVSAGIRNGARYDIEVIMKNGKPSVTVGCQEASMEKWRSDGKQIILEQMLENSINVDEVLTKDDVIDVLTGPEKDLSTRSGELVKKLQTEYEEEIRKANMVWEVLSKFLDFVEFALPEDEPPAKRRARKKGSKKGGAKKVVA